ncbi:MAG: T9SS type A sorting domain-containing protein [Candidatus Cloacimonetes bacterium]|nr:T9SS type A sorting domain-containing protein [Candidatus Cloacimonadota bacterium]
MRIDRKNVFFVLVIAMFFCVSLFSLHTETLAEPPSNFHDDNAGSEENPFLIANLANLRWLSETPDVWCEWVSGSNFLWYHFLQTADIDATETIYWEDGCGFRPIGVRNLTGSAGNDKGFMGVYDGNGYSIKNLFINCPHNIVIYCAPVPGMFGVIQNGTIKNLRLENVNILPNEDLHYNQVGPLAGIIQGGLIENVSVTGQMVIEASSRLTGGLAGDASHTTIRNSYSSLFIIDATSHSIRIGGLVGYLYNSTIENSYFNGFINSSIESDGYGGLVGRASESRIRNCYVVSEDSFININSFIGWISHPNPTGFPSIITNNLWDEETTGITQLFNVETGQGTVSGNYGKTTAEMKQATTYIDNGWDFENIWFMKPFINNGYPYLRSMIDARKTPGNFNAEIVDGDIVLTWEEPGNEMDNGFHQNFGQLYKSSINYRIYRNDVFLVETTELSYIDTDIELDEKYNYFLIALYEDGDFGATDLSIITVVYSPPKNLVAWAGDGEVTLSWESSDVQKYGEVLRYNIYRDGVLIDEVLSPPYKARQIEYIDKGLKNGDEHEYYITAVWGGEIDGVSEPTNIVNIVLDFMMLPPTELEGSVSNVNGNTVIINWKPPYSENHDGENRTSRRINNSVKRNVSEVESLKGYNIYRDEDFLFFCQASGLSNYRYIQSYVPVGEYVYSVSAVYNGGESEYVSVEIEVYASEFEDIEVPLMTELVGNFPNPFNPETMIKFNIAVESIVSIDIYNIRGQRVRNLLNESMKAGFHQVLWNGEDEYGRDVGSGMYFYVMRAGDFTTVRRMVLLK